MSGRPRSRITRLERRPPQRPARVARARTARPRSPGCRARARARRRSPRRPPPPASRCRAMRGSVGRSPPAPRRRFDLALTWRRRSAHRRAPSVGRHAHAKLLTSIAALALHGRSSPPAEARRSNTASAQSERRRDSPPGDIPDNQAFVRYPAGGDYSVKVPEGWARSAARRRRRPSPTSSTAIRLRGVAGARAADRRREASCRARTVKAFPPSVSRRAPAGHAVRITYLAPRAPQRR